jgi:hypothetical protein
LPGTSNGSGMAFWSSGDCSSNLQLTSEMLAVIVSMQKSNNELIGAIVVYFAKKSRDWSRGLGCQENNGADNRHCEYGGCIGDKAGLGRDVIGKKTFRLTFRFFPPLLLPTMHE